MTENDDSLSLTPEQISEARKNYEAITAFLMQLTDRVSPTCTLMSKGNDGMWMQTGFQVDDASGRLSAKVGDFPYQPIGLYNDGAFVPNAANKIFWSREFRFATLEEVLRLPFTSVRVRLDDANLTLNDAMLKQGEEVLAEIKSELDKLVAMTPEERKQEAESIREYNKLLCMKFPPLDGFLRDNIQRNPELAGILDQMDPTNLLITQSEWLNTKLEDERFRRRIGGLKTIRNDLSAAEQLVSSFKTAVESKADAERCNRLLNGAYVIDPLLRETIDREVVRGVAPCDIIAKLLIQLERRLANG